MRYLSFALLVVCPLFAQNDARTPQKSQNAMGMFYVDGIIYQYSVGKDAIVVAAAHSAINRKFAAVKVRVYNTGQQSLTIKPTDVRLEDGAGRVVAAVSGTDLATKMRKPYNMARYGVNAVAGSDPEMPITSDMAPQMLEMMRTMMARSNGGVMPGGKNLLYTDTPGELETGRESERAPECDLVCRLRNREAVGAYALVQLQRQTSPDAVEQFAFLANTVPPHANAGGVVFYPLGKLTESGSSNGKKVRRAQLTVIVEEETFRFELPVE
ncbi:MAG TPA: hypothetical protein VKB58_09885 [Terriglobales bacterium]|nr:hypothetical protein [Terriglobales bacterium]